MRQHLAVITAIEARDAEKARAEMTAHITGSQQRALKLR